MKTKIASIIALFALLVLGTVLVAVPNEAATTETSNVYNVADPYVQPLAAGCTRVCSWCVKYGNNGACSLSGACC